MACVKFHPVIGWALVCAGLLAGCSDGESLESSGGADLAGTISIESRTRIDLDTADDVITGTARPNAVVSLPSGAVAAGYLSALQGFYQSDAGASFEYFADPRDEFAVNLADGDRIAVQVFGPPEDYLSGVGLPQITVAVEANGAGTALEQISGYGSADIAIDSVGGTPVPHQITLRADDGAPFRYVLQVINNDAASAGNVRYAEPPFRPGEAVVVMEPQAGALATSSMASSAAANARPLGQGVWHLRNTALQGPVSVSSGSGAMPSATETLGWIAELRQQPGIRSAEPNYLYTTQQVPSSGPSLEDEEFYRSQWNLPLIQLPLGWQLAPELGAGVGVAVMDTGLFTVSPRTSTEWHSDLDANVKILPGQIMDFVSEDLDIDYQLFQDAPGPDQNPADPGDGKPQSSNFHGTHVAGIIAAGDNEQGILGLAPNIDLYPVRVLGKDGVGSLSDLVNAINWAAGRSEIQVINLSLGGLGDSRALRGAIDNVVSRGKLVVSAAGNQGSDEPTYPAAYGNVVGVGAVDGAGKRATYSNLGASVDVVAPGGDVLRDANQDGSSDLIISAWGQDEGGNFREAYAGLQGTSMAAPHVSGLYALMKAEQPTLTPQGFISLLEDGQLTAAPPNRFEYGNGLIDVVKAMSTLDGEVPSVLGAQPTVLQFTRAVVRQQVELVGYPDNDSVSIDESGISVSEGAAWLDVVPDIENMSLAVSASVSGLPEGETRRAEIIVPYSGADGARQLVVPVTQQSGDALDDRDAGRHYVLLVSTDDAQETVRQAVVEAEGGQYQFAFNDVPQGEYFLVAGTDTDNNGLICESGEACAEYPVNGLPEPVVYNGGPLQGLRLSTSFRRPAISALGQPRYGFNGYHVKSSVRMNSDKQVRRAD